MALERIAELLPEYAKDIKLNLTSLFRQTELSEETLWAVIVSCAYASRNTTVITDVVAEASEILSPAVLQAAQGAAALMAMNNIFYRFGHLSSNENYLKMPSGLRMNFIRTHGVDSNLFELCCLAVSAINGCGLCVDSHEKKLRDEGVSETSIHTAVRVASILHAVGATLPQA